jgi:hypothetical protein
MNTRNKAKKKKKKKRTEKGKKTPSRNLQNRQGEPSLEKPVKGKEIIKRKMEYTCH